MWSAIEEDLFAWFEQSHHGLLISRDFLGIVIRLDQLDFVDVVIRDAVLERTTDD